MKTKSSAYYQREYRQRLRNLGLIKKEVWILPENARQLSHVEKLLRKKNPNSFEDIGEKAMPPLKKWTTESLYDALLKETLFTGEQAGIELIGGVEPALHIIMHEYGDLPLFLTVAGEQIIIEAVLWSADELNDSNKFNDTVLRTHKYFPLSTISLDTLSDGNDYYHMFGALSATSVMSNIIFEIETLSANVINATEAYSNFIKTPLQIKE